MNTYHNNDYLMGIDIGTTILKIVIFDLRGNQIAIAKRQNPLIKKNGYSECDMEKVWLLLCDICQEINLKFNNIFQNVKSVGICGNMVGLWALDKNNKPVSNAILWNDERSINYIEEWRENGIMDEVFKESCMVMNPGFTIPLFRWLKDNLPHIIKKCKTFLFAKDWIRFKLTGEIFTDETDISHIPGNIRERNISIKILKECAVEDLKEYLPPILKSDEIAGYITDEASSLTGIPTGIPVVAGLGDVPACIVGAGSIEDKDATIILGTSCLNNITVKDPVFIPFGIGLSFLIPDKYVRTLSNQTGTIAIDWYIKEFFNIRELKTYDYYHIEQYLSSNVPLGSNGLLFYPYLNNTGVLAPIYQPKARATLWGLNINHTKYDILKALYEGIVYASADCFDNLPAYNSPIKLVGGGAKSRFWQRLFADILGQPIAILNGEEQGALGAALVAGKGIGIWHEWSEAVSSCCNIKEIVEPDEAKHQIYVENLTKYKKIRKKIYNE